MGGPWGDFENACQFNFSLCENFGFPCEIRLAVGLSFADRKKMPSLGRLLGSLL